MTKEHKYQQILTKEQETVVYEYQPSPDQANNYQSEAQLEKEFINILANQGYQYLPDVNNKETLIANLKTQMELLNDYQFSPNEWKRFYSKYLVDENNNSPQAKSKMLHQNGHIFSFELDNGQVKNFKIIDKKNIYKNSLQVINQYVNDGGKYHHRYDVTILVNGLPLVQIELKRRGQDLQEAFNQINRYKYESFLSEAGLFEYLQIFVISNGTMTRYYANTTRELHVKNNERKQVANEANSSFSFTNKWADSKNQNIDDLNDFAQTFFAKHTLLNILTKYCVFSVDDKLLVMRPYQIVAVEKILQKIQIANYDKAKLGTSAAGGYVWHTTGSGKTLTSFKVTQLAKDLEYIDKVLFVVDRQDLDYQTIKEYEKFQEGSVLSNRSSKVLQQQLEDLDQDKKVIITTIQKLTNFVKNSNSKNPIFNKQVVLIFDECHRSQFGEMHKIITKAFKKYYLFGFTGTPIFAANANTSLGSIKSLAALENKQSLQLKTTEQLFGDRLHAYTVIDAIKDGNVLKFNLSFCTTFKENEKMRDYQVEDIDRAEVWESMQRIGENVNYILEHFNQKTYRFESRAYHHDLITNISELSKVNHKQNAKAKYVRKKIFGFNSILACANIEVAKKYYLEFQRQQKAKATDLKIAIIYSFNPNENYENQIGYIDEENNEDTSQLDQSSKEFLASAINDYNQIFGTSFNITGESFLNYYKDISLRMKNKEIDLLIVVNMFLTGFDAPTLNTLWVDKWMRMHGLMQAFSRTNRILNKTKTHGNIIAFRPIGKFVDEAIALFADRSASGLILMKTFEQYYDKGYENEYGQSEPCYKDLVALLKKEFDLNQIMNVFELELKIKFIRLFGQILKLRSILLSFDEFIGKDLLTRREIQNYLSYYHDFYDAIKAGQKEKESILEDLIFEVDLARTYDTSIAFLIEKIQEYKSKNKSDRDLITEINLLINSSGELRSKKDLVHEFVSVVNEDENIYEQFDTFNENKKYEQVKQIIKKYQLDEEPTIQFLNDCWNYDEFKIEGRKINDLLKDKNPYSLFSKEQGENYSKWKKEVIDDLKECFNKFKFN